MSIIARVAITTVPGVTPPVDHHDPLTDQRLPTVRSAGAGLDRPGNHSETRQPRGPGSRGDPPGNPAPAAMRAPATTCPDNRAAGVVQPVGRRRAAARPGTTPS
jgi:hypothetical protein